MYTTNDLRFIDRNGKKILQQKFIVGGEDICLRKAEWRDVPCEPKNFGGINFNNFKSSSWYSPAGVVGKRLDIGDCVTGLIDKKPGSTTYYKSRQGQQKTEHERVCDEIIDFVEKFGHNPHNEQFKFIICNKIKRIRDKK